MTTPDKIPATILVIFGITGDLSGRYLLPSLAKIKQAGKLPNDFKILGITRRDVSASEVLSADCSDLEGELEVLKMDLENAQDYERLKTHVSEVEKAFGQSAHVIFYLVVPPAAAPTIISHLGAAGLNGPNSKLLLEKPFGTDLQSARQLIEQTARCFNEKQIYRIDHYLAKEMAQNIVVFLGGNALFQDVWNNRFIEKIEVTASETLGVEGRESFYEQTGALRDFVQSHLLQLAALVLMKPCTELFNFEEVPARRLEALKALRPALDQSLVRAQYEGYRQDVNNPASSVETFVSLTLNSSDPRWNGVPIILSAGKKLDQKLSLICVHFKKSEVSQANMLYLRIQPDEAVELDLWVKKPGYERELQKKQLNFSYGDHFDKLPEAYEQVLVDAIRSDQSLFAAGEEVIAAWEVLQPVLDYWQAHPELKTYRPGSSLTDINTL